ncbi:GPCR fungal pheromone mating factor [Mycena crocata]|nr:GPCR fungal pheromone mating factor [Mycena crocata]
MKSALPAVPFISFILVLSTFPHHWRVGNLATLSVIIWLSAYNLIYAVNAVIWEGNVEITVPVWCDIVTKLKLGADAALPGCCLCIARQLHGIASGAGSSPRRWRQRLLDLSLCCGLPVIVMTLHYIVQPHRFDIVQDIGCIPAIYVSWPSLIILEGSGLVPATVALIYCAMALIKIRRRRITITAMLDKIDSSLSVSQYIRLMILAVFIGLWTILPDAASGCQNAMGGLEPWVSWDYVHDGFSFIGQYASEDIRPQDLRTIWALWLLVPLTSLIFFALFGFGQEGMRDYRAIADWTGSSAKD